MAPIHDAARDANVAELGRLLAEGASPDAMRTVRHPQETPLHVLFGDQHNGAIDGSMDARVACFELLRDAGANLEAGLGGMSQGITVLHLAAKGYPRVLSLLVEEGVNVNAANGSGYTPLHWAAYKDESLTAQWLVDHGADLAAEDWEKCLPVHWAALKGHFGEWRKHLDHVNARCLLHFRTTQYMWL